VGFCRICWDGTTGEGWCIEVIADVADDPFVVKVDCGRVVETPAIASALLVGHGPALGGFFRAKEPRSPEGDIWTPLVWGEG
jgi:hypothetical protein